MTDESAGQRPASPRRRITDAATVGSYRFGALAAKMMPAEVITEPVLATVRSTPTRMLRVDSSLSRETSSML